MLNIAILPVSNITPSPEHKTLMDLICITYLKCIGDKSTIHPLICDTIANVIHNAQRVVNITQDLYIKEAIDSILTLHTPTDDVYVSVTSITRAFATCTTNMPIEFYQPFFLTLSNIKYIGQAILPSIMYLPNAIVFNFINTRYIFDNTKFDGESFGLFFKFSPFWKYITSFDFTKCTFNKLIQILANNSVPTCTYKGNILFTELCSRLLTRGYNPNCVHGSNPLVECSDRYYIVLLLRYLCEFGDLQLGNTEYLAMLSGQLKIDKRAIDYLNKVNNCTIAERDAFMSSPLSTYKKNSGLEALEKVDEENENTLEESVAEKDTTEESDNEDGDPIEEEVVEEEIVEEATNEVPDDKDVPDDDITLSDTKLFDIELSKGESILDILYKEHICEIVSSYRRDLPNDISAEELLLLEIWCARWIFLVSAQTTKRLLRALAITVG